MYAKVLLRSNQFPGNDRISYSSSDFPNIMNRYFASMGRVFAKSFYASMGGHILGRKHNVRLSVTSLKSVPGERSNFIQFIRLSK